MLIWKLAIKSPIASSICRVSNTLLTKYAKRTREAVGNLLHGAFGVVIDKELNYNLRGKEGIISSKESKIPVVVIPTDEEVMIARDAYNMCIKGEK